MALTRRLLKSMGIDEEKIEQIVEAHAETVDALKNERNKYKDDAEKLNDMQKKYDDLKKQVETQGVNVYEEKYNTEHEAFKKYKAEVEAERVKAEKVKDYKNLLRKAGVSEKRIEAILKVTAIDEVDFSDEEKTLENIRNEWGDFIVRESQQGANTETPPLNVGGSKMTKADIYKKDEHGRYVLSTAERQKALMEMSANN